MQLYARPGSGSFVVEAILSEAGASYEVDDVESPARAQSARHLLSSIRWARFQL